MSFFVYFTKDPVIGPTHGQRCKKDSKLYFKSVGYSKGDPAPVFTIKFDNTDILTRYNKSASYPPLGDTGVDARTWQSKKVGKYQQILIKLKGSDHPDDGYKYDVEMDGIIWDPRVVPR